jgi:hypothetical protein
MAGKIVADTLEHSTAGSLSTEYVVNGSAKAWVHFTSVTTTTAQDSLNISSLTDTDTGDTTVNISNAFSNDDYSCVMFTNANSGTGVGAFGNDFTGGLFSRTTSSIAHTAYNGTSPIDSALNDIVFHGDLA